MDPRFPPSAAKRSPRGNPNPTAGFYAMKASPAAVQWWGTHVYRTHLRSPISSPRAMTPGYGSPRSPRAGVTLPGLEGMYSSRAMTPASTVGSTCFPGFVKGAALPPRPGQRHPQNRLVDPMMDNTPMSKGGVADHPLKKQLSQMWKSMKMIDFDHDGFLAPNDIQRGLGMFLSVSDKVHVDAVNKLVMQFMKSNGMVEWGRFLYGLAADRTVTGYIKAGLDEKERSNVAAWEEANKKPPTPKGPELRAGVTADDLRKAQTVIKDKLMDKFSGLTQAFRAMDLDSSGYVSRHELERMLHNLNLSGIRPVVIDTLVDFIDCINDVADDDEEGATDIAYREFARAFATDDIMSMQALAILERKGPPPTPPPQNLVAENVQKVVMSKFKPDQMKKAFDFLDVDKSKSLTRAEMKRALFEWGMLLTDDEMTELFKACDKDGDGTIDYSEFCDMVAKQPHLTKTRSLVKNPALRKGVREKDLRMAQHFVKEHFTTKFGRLTKAFQFVDRDRTGTITREELRLVIGEFNLTNIRPEVIENLIDFIDIDPEGDIEYKEFARVISADDVMAMAPLSLVPAEIQSQNSMGRHKMDGMPGAQGLSWLSVAK
jgi:Ca2+-binding EF-hand superfamily protein